MLAAQHIRLVAELKRLSRTDMEARFGKRGLEWYANVRAQDDAPVEEHGEPKSISEQETFAEDTLDSQILVERLSQIGDGVFARLVQEGLKPAGPSPSPCGLQISPRLPGPIPLPILCGMGRLCVANC